MSELSYVHRMNPSPASMQGGTAKMPPNTGRTQEASLSCCDHGEAGMRLAMENQARWLEYERSLGQARADSHKFETQSKELQARVGALESRIKDHERQARHTTEEARRWKQNHDDVRAAARELSYKTTLAEHKLRELEGKHKNLHENHAAMQAKYRELKNSVKAAQEGTAKTESDWQKNAAKWKQRCQDAVDKYEAMSKDAAQKIKEHVAAREKAEAVSKAVSDKLKEYVASNEQLAKKNKAAATAYSELQREHDQLKADHKVSCNDNARFHKEHTKLTIANNVLTQENEQFLVRMKQANVDAAELARLKAEMPAVKAQLAKAAKMQEEVAGLSRSNQLLATEIKDLKGRSKAELKEALQEAKKAHTDELLKYEAALGEAKKALAAERLKHKSETSSLQSKHAAEINAVKEGTQAQSAASADELRTAKKNISEKSQELAQTLKMNETLKGESMKNKEGLRDCRHMLENAHKVLRVCADYHAKSSGASSSDTPLFTALSEACKTVDKFLAVHPLVS